MTPEGAAKADIRAYLDTLEPEGFFEAFPASDFGKSGKTDFIGVYYGWPVAIEAKAVGGKHPVTSNQKKFLLAWRRAGGISIVARTSADVRAVLERLRPRPKA